MCYTNNILSRKGVKKMSQKSNAKIISLSIRPELLKLVDDFAEKTFRTRAGVFEMMIVNFFQSNDKANPQPTESTTTGEK